MIRKGSYSLWLSGKMFAKTPIGEFGFHLINQQTGEPIPLSTKFLRTTISGIQTGRIELYSFHAEEGTYLISLKEKASIRDKAAFFITNTLIKHPVDYSLFSIQVRKHIPVSVLLLCILGIVFESALILSGIILPIFL